MMRNRITHNAVDYKNLHPQNEQGLELNQKYLQRIRASDEHPALMAQIK